MVKRRVMKELGRSLRYKVHGLCDIEVECCCGRRAIALAIHRYMYKYRSSSPTTQARELRACLFLPLHSRPRQCQCLPRVSHASVQHCSNRDTCGFRTH